MPHFFFSYARDDARDDALVYELFDDLTAEVGARLGSRADVGFLDSEQGPGGDWATTTGNALGTCDVFVPVYSSYYFSSPYCAQEWHGFHARLTEHRRATGETPACVVPVWWRPPRGGVPDGVSATQDTRGSFGAEHEKEGLRYLMRLKSRRDAYRMALHELGAFIADAMRTPARPVGVIDLAAMPDTFRTRPPHNASGRPARGTRTVRFVIVAEGAERMRQVRSAVESYGDTWRDWQPYPAESQRPLALRAQRAASRQHIVVEAQVPLEADVEDVIKAARERNELVVLLLDPWAACLEEYSGILAGLNHLRYPNTAFVMPWEADAEDAGVADDALADCLPFLSTDDRWFHEDIHSLAQFDATLTKVLGEVRRRLVKQAPRARRAAGPGPSALPVVAGPGPDAP